jgi:hypothetical protein
MPVTEDHIWLLDMMESLKAMRDELTERDVNCGQVLTRARYHMTIALETLFDYEQFLSGEAVMGMD